MTPGGGLIRTLLIEDSPDDALLMQAELRDATRASFEVEWVSRLSEGLERLVLGGIDVVLLDLSLPDSSGAETCHRVHAEASGVPIVVLTGLDDEALAMELLKEGAQDYLIKGQVEGSLLVRSLLYAIERHRLLTQLQAAKESAETRLRAVVDNTPIILFALDDTGVFTLSEGKGLDSLGRRPADLVGRSVFEVFADVPGIVDNVSAALVGEPRNVIVEVDGITFDARYQPVFDRSDNILGVVGVAHDVTELRKLEDQLRQSQKMEAIGQLAGGIAHDFNNLLSAMLGYAELGLTRASQDEQITGYLNGIRKAAERAAHLTGQLLAFSRRQVVEPRAINLNETVMDLDKMLRRLIGENIEFTMITGGDLGSVEADPSQIELVIINLVVNARDAIPEGGKLVIETANVVLGEEDSEKHSDATPGEFVRVSVTDDGTGMTEEVKARAFEPFFTTKEVGKGTGLGLSSCFGIVSQSGGHISIDSLPGRGTTVAVYLPRVATESQPAPAIEDSVPVPSGSETVLLVDDEPLVGEMAGIFLGEQGYRVLMAGDGVEATRLALERPRDGIDLLLTDVVMPRMSGKELAETVRERHPDDTLASYGVSGGQVDFLQKPFALNTLAGLAREVLDRA